jgi:hypothetical protein
MIYLIGSNPGIGFHVIDIHYIMCEYESLFHVKVIHLIHRDKLMKIVGTRSTLSKILFVSSILPLSVTSTAELFPVRIGGPLNASNEEYNYFLESMWCDVPESMIQTSGEELMEINAWLEFPFLGL